MGNKLVWLQESYVMSIARYKCLMMATTTGQIGDSGSICTRFPVPPNYPTHRIAPLHSTTFAIATFGPWTRGQSNKKFGTSL